MNLPSEPAVTDVLLRREWPYVTVVALAIVIILGSTLGGRSGNCGHMAGDAARGLLSAVPSQEELQVLWSVPLGRLWLVAEGVGNLAGVVLLLYALLRWRRWRREPALVPEATWNAWDIAKVTAIYVVLLAIGSAPAGSQAESVWSWVADCAARAGAVALALHVVLRERRGSWRALGLDLRDWRGSLVFGAAAYLAFKPVYIGVENMARWLWHQLKVQPVPQQAVVIFASTDSAAVRVAISLMAVLVAPLTEEFFFRGLVQGVVRRCWGRGLAILVGALIFALLHANLYALPELLALGIVLGWTYERTRSLVAPVMVHCLHNGMVLLLLWARVGSGV